MSELPLNYTENFTDDAEDAEAVQETEAVAAAGNLDKPLTYEEALKEDIDNANDSEAPDTDLAAEIDEEEIGGYETDYLPGDDDLI